MTAESPVSELFAKVRGLALGDETLQALLQLRAELAEDVAGRKRPWHSGAFT